MATWKPDPSFYPSPRMAMKAPPETVAYVASFDPKRKSPDGIAVVDVDPKSKTYATIIDTVPGLRSSRIHIIDTKPNARKPKIVKVIEPAELAERAGYTRPSTPSPMRGSRRSSR